MNFGCVLSVENSEKVVNGYALYRSKRNTLR